MFLCIDQLLIFLSYEIILLRIHAKFQTWYATRFEIFLMNTTFWDKPLIVVTLQIRLDFQVIYNSENVNITLQIESVIWEEGGCSGKTGEYSVLYC